MCAACVKVQCVCVCVCVPLHFCISLVPEEITSSTTAGFTTAALIPIHVLRQQFSREPVDAEY